MFVVGVSALNLCQSNCTWAGDMEIELYPWDGGTDDGITFMVCLLLLLSSHACVAKICHHVY